MGLNELARKYKTDKGDQGHNYVSVYESLFEGFRKDTFNFLEIGLCRGASHKMWRDWFPNATIYGVDIDAKIVNRFRYEERMVVEKVDQSDRQQLIEYSKKGPWRVIIDDGSHVTSHQNKTFEILWDQVEPGGYYVVEDTFTSYASFTLDKSARTHDAVNVWMDSKETLMQRMLRLTDEVCEWAVSSKHHREVEYVQFSLGLVIVKKRADIK